MSTNYSKQSDIELIELIVNNDLTAFDEIYKRYSKDLQRIIALVIKDNAAVEDVLQETLIRAYRALGNYKAQASLKTWLTRIAVNLSINYIQRVKKKASKLNSIDEKTDPDSNSSNYFESKFLKSNENLPEDQMITSELGQLLRRIVEEELDPVSQLIIDLRFFQEYSIKEISKIVSKPQGTIRSKLFYAKKILKRRVDKDFPDLSQFLG